MLAQGYSELVYGSKRFTFTSVKQCYQFINKSKYFLLSNQTVNLCMN